MNQRLIWALSIFCALLPTYLIRFSLFGIPTTMLECLFLMLFGWWVFEKKMGVVETLKIFASFKITWPIFAILLAATINIFVSPNLASALGIWKAYFIEPFLFGLILFDVLKHTSPNKLYLSLGASALFVSVFGLIQRLFNLPIPKPWDVEHRITSIYPYPNAVALFVAPIMMLALFESTKKHTTKHWQRLFWVSVYLFGWMAIFLAQSEAAMASVLFVTFLFFLSKKQTRIFAIIASVLVALVCLFFLPAREAITQKIQFKDWSERVRISQWTETMELLKDHPLFVAGLNGYPTALKPYHKATYLEIFQYPHNLFLNAWVELGLLGLFGLLVLIGMMKWCVITTNPFYLSGSALALTQIGIHGLVDVPYFKNDLSMLTAILLILFFFDYVYPRHASKK